MRLFTAIDLSEEVLANVERLIKRLRPTARIQWSPPTNLHITTKFIGEWPESRLAELKTALAGLPPRPPIPVGIARLGYFPNPHSPRVFWAGIQAPGLEGLARDTDQALEELGVPPEKRAFSPHLTLARIKEPVPLTGLLQAVAGLPSLDFGSFVAGRFYLYLSRLQPGGSVYTRLAEFEFPTA
jgi:RNA 2',3'-cyclic 3'-phosphodiesterase